MCDRSFNMINVNKQGYRNYIAVKIWTHQRQRNWRLSTSWSPTNGVVLMAVTKKRIVQYDSHDIIAIAKSVC